VAAVASANSLAVAPKPIDPLWPANDPPTAASVHWDSRGLSVEATNSSLTQILKEITIQTGITVEGQGGDQRIFGFYGPGAARDILKQLLDGTGYNLLMIGEQGPGIPRRLVLSRKDGTQTAASPPPAVMHGPGEEDFDPENPDDPSQQMRSSNLVMQQREQARRQQQMQQQQQQQQMQQQIQQQQIQNDQNNMER